MRKGWKIGTLDGLQQLVLQKEMDNVLQQCKYNLYIIVVDFHNISSSKTQSNIQLQMKELLEVVCTTITCIITYMLKLSAPQIPSPYYNIHVEVVRTINACTEYLNTHAVVTASKLKTKK